MPVTKTFNGSPGDTPHTGHTFSSTLLITCYASFSIDILNSYGPNAGKIGKTAYNCTKITWPGPRVSPPAG